MSTRLESWLSYRVLDKRSAPRKRAPWKWGRGPARNERYKGWIRTLDCCACGGGPSQAAHTGTDGGAKLKASDWSCVPLCNRCHRGLYHGINGGKKTLERLYCIDFEAICQRLRATYVRLGGKVAI
jgi:hypothetical protein